MVDHNTSLTKPLHGSFRSLLTVMDFPTFRRALAFSLRSLGIIGLLLLLFTSYAHSAIINASSCSRADIQAAVDQASAGDVVQLPACTNSSWAGTVNISKAIAIAGQGETQTVITKPGTSTAPMISVDCSTGLIGFEFYGITLGGRGDEQTLDRGLALINRCQDFRIYHSTFQKFGHAGIYIRGKADGVVYECKFLENFRPGRGYGLEVIGDGTYPPLELGTGNAVFVEDSYFRGSRHNIASNNGSRYVFRYNTIVDNREDGAAIDAHGYPSSTWPRGSRSYEVYNNSIVNSVNRWAGVGPRGGDGVIFNNTTSKVDHPILLMNEGSGSADGCKTYPCQDQIRELYIWNNTPSTVDHWRQIDSELVQEGRDYFLYPRPGYTPYAYPHPLRVQFDDSESPAPPTGLKILP